MPALAFHKLMPSFSWGITNFHPSKLRRLLDCLQHWQYQLDTIDSPDQTDNKRIQLTFDDGYQHLIHALPPIVETYGINPVIFVPTAFIGRANTWDYSHFMQPVQHLSREEIRELSDFGVIFGSHGHSHTDLTYLPPEKLADELNRSRDHLQAITGKQVDCLSYPFGRTNRKVTEAAAACGYQTGYTMRFPGTEDNPLNQGRIAIYAIDSPMTVKWKLSTGAMTQIERAKSSIIHSFSAGTGLLNRWRRK